MWWPRRRSPSRTTPASATSSRQVWTRSPSPTEAEFGRFPQFLDVGSGTGDVYADELDADWVDPTTADWNKPAADR